MNLTLYTILFFIIYNIPYKLYSQDNIKFKHLSIEEGLSQVSCMSIFQDSKGYMWIGTQEGLNKYDGYKFTVYKYDPENENSINHNWITSIIEDSKGNFWVGTLGGGLNLFDRERQTFKHFISDSNLSNSISNNFINYIIEKENKLWIATRNGLNTLDLDTYEFNRYFPSDESNSDENQISTLFYDSNSNLWVGTQKGMKLFNIHKKEFIDNKYTKNSPLSIKDRNILSVFEDSKGNIWIGTDRNGLFYYNTKDQVLTELENSIKELSNISRDIVGSIIEDKNGNIWVGSWTGGLNLYDEKTGKFKQFKHQNHDPFSLSNNFVSSIYQDNQGNLWVGTWLAGLNVLDLNKNRFNHYNKKENTNNSLNHNIVRALYEGPTKNDVWIATFGGLNHYNSHKKQFTQFLHDPNDKYSISSDLVRCILIDDNNDLWVGTFDGLNKYNPKTKKFTRYLPLEKDPSSISWNDIMSLFIDSKNNFWIGTRGGGLNFLDRKKGVFKHFKHDEKNITSLSNDFVTCMAEDQQGNFWVGTRIGLNLFNYKDSTFRYFKSDKNINATLSNNWIMSMLVAQNGELWIGTRGGLNKYDASTNSFSNISEKNGLSNNVIYGVLEDSQNNLWLSTNRGINKYNPNTSEITIYTENDGLQSNEFNTGAFHKGKSGTLYFGGVNGFNAFNPDNILKNNFIPPVEITDFLLFNKQVQVSDTTFLDKSISFKNELTLMHNDYIFGFEFSALNYRQPEKNQFAYFLEGFDKDWTYTNYKYRRATYTNIPSGTYTFKVKASNNDGVWNNIGKNIVINILPPPWLSWWAKTIYALLIFGISYLIVKNQRDKIKRKEKELKRERQTAEKLSQINKLKDAFLANTSHELKTPLNGIIGLTESIIEGAAGEINKKAADELKLVVSSGKRLSGLINDILDFSKLKNKQLNIEFKPVDIHVISEIVISISRPIASKKEIIIFNEIPKDVALVNGDENRIQQILLNLIDNAIKFTEKGVIKLACKKEDNHLIVEVKDTGIGIEEKNYELVFKSFEQLDTSLNRKFQGTGIGLSITKQLVELHRGKIWINSKVGQGTSFYFSLQISNADRFDNQSTTVNIENNYLESSENLPILDQDIDDLLIEEKIEPLRNASYFNILIVDDEPINLKVLENYLTLQNYNVYKANHGEIALEMIEEIPNLHMVILDIMMPKISGYDVCLKIREKYTPLQLPVILLTAKNLQSDLVTGYKSGANDYLTKPFSKEELLLRIKTQLQLVKANKELEGYSQSLEQKVKERTLALKQKSIQLEKTNNIVKSINNEVNIENLLNAILKETKIIKGVERASALIYNEDKNKFIFRASLGWDIREFELIQMTYDETQNRYVRFSQEIYEDIFITRNVKNLLPDNKNGSLKETPKSMLILQIRIEEMVKAYFIFDNMRSKDAFEVHDIELLKNLKEHITSALIKTETVNKLQQTFLDLAKSNKKLKNAFNKLKKLDEFKEVMTGMIIHDFKNDLNTIIGFTEGIPDERRIKSIRQAGRNMLHMVLNILDVQKFENTSIELSYSQENISEAVQGAVDEVSFLIQQKYISLTYDIETISEIEYDFALIKRTILNILINAIKYTPNNGKIHIEVSQKGKYLHFAIKDSGPGIPKDKLNEVFDKFAQLKSKSSETIRSTGLGLTFCKMVVEAHQGKIGVESDIGEGSLFWFTLPITHVKKKIKVSKPKIVLEQDLEPQFNLLGSEKSTLQPYLLKLKNLEVYDFSDVNDILSKIDKKDSPALTNWVEEMHKALRNVNQKKFEELINL